MNKYLSLCIIGNLIILIIAFLSEENMDAVTICSLTQLCLNLYAICRSQLRIVLIASLFLLISYLFHFGQALIPLFRIEDLYYDRSVTAVTSNAEFISSQLFAMVCFASIAVSYLIHAKRNIIEDSPVNLDLGGVRKLATIVLIVTVFPMLYVDFHKMIALSLGGYEATYDVYASGIAKYFNQIAVLCKPSISLLIFASCKKPKIARNIFLVSCIYYVLMMLSGDRGTYMIYIICNAFVYFRFVQRLTLKISLIGLCAFAFLMSFMSAISMFRYTEFSFDALVDSFTARSDDGFLYSILREFGGTMLSLVYIMKYVPSYSGFGYGLTYIYGTLMVSPWLPSSVSEAISPFITYVQAIPHNAYGYESLGGSYLGELYFNFGWLSPIIAFFIGSAISKFDRIITNRNNLLKLVLCIVVIPYVILWVRDFFCVMFFAVFWYYVLMKMFVIKTNSNGHK